jgi:putative acetyltransferase
MGVVPEHQRCGIGGQLIEAGNGRLREAGCPFIVVMGHPNYYPRFGFTPASRYGFTSEWERRDDVFMVLMLNPERTPRISGLAKFRPEFSTVS